MKSEFLSGNGKTYSKILKFDLEKKEYETAQRILTYGCSDIEYFRTNFNNEAEHFVITANYYYDKGRLLFLEERNSNWNVRSLEKLDPFSNVPLLDSFKYSHAVVFFALFHGFVKRKLNSVNSLMWNALITEYIYYVNLVVGPNFTVYAVQDKLAVICQYYL